MTGPVGAIGLRYSGIAGQHVDSPFGDWLTWGDDQAVRNEVDIVAQLSRSWARAPDAGDA